MDLTGFKKELEVLLNKYPEVEDITFTIKQSQTVKRGDKIRAAAMISPSEGSATGELMRTKLQIAMVSDEDELSDVHVKSLLDKIKDIPTNNE